MNSPKWITAATFAARKALRYIKGPFVGETLLAATLKYVEEPADRRAFGHVVRRLHADGVIKRHGFGKAVTSNRAMKPMWVRS